MTSFVSLRSTGSVSDDSSDDWENPIIPVVTHTKPLSPPPGGWAGWGDDDPTVPVRDPTPEPDSSQVKEAEVTIIRVTTTGDADRAVRQTMPYLLEHRAAIDRANVALNTKGGSGRQHTVEPFGNLCIFLRRAVAYAKTNSVGDNLTQLTRAVTKAKEDMRAESSKPATIRDLQVLKTLALKVKEKEALLERAKKNVVSMEDHKAMTRTLQRFVDTLSHGNDSGCALAEQFRDVYSKLTGTKKVATTSTPVTVVVVRPPTIPAVSAPAASAPAASAPAVSAPAVSASAVAHVPYVSRFSKARAQKA